MTGFVTEILVMCISLVVLGITILMLVIIPLPHYTIAQTLESILSEKSAFKDNPQIEFGVGLRSIAINTNLNKVYAPMIEQILSQFLIVILEI